MLQKVQYVIIGAGSAGLQLAKALLDMQKPRVSSILLIDQSDVMIDKTWCFWCNLNHQYSSLVKKEWPNIAFKAGGNSVEESILPMTYQYIQSGEFYRYHQQIFSKDDRIDCFIGDVKELTFTEDEAIIHLGEKIIRAEYVFCTDAALLTTKNLEPKIWQHFIGWTIETTEACFKTQTFTMMDFDLEDRNDLQFMYVLPFNATKALIECTIFSASIGEPETYEKYIRNYISKNFTQNYQITHVEVGKIPMQLSGKYENLNKRVIPIGSAAGRIKASTGYSFIRNMEHTAKIINIIENREATFTIKRNLRFEFYDLLLLDIIANKPRECVEIFSKLFKNNSVKLVLKFLDEKTTIFEDIKIFASLPKWLFIKALIKKL